MVSIPNPTLNLNMFSRDPRAGLVPSPVSPKPWQATLSELTQGLQKICGPGDGGGTSPFLGGYGTQSPNLTPSPDRTPQPSPSRSWGSPRGGDSFLLRKKAGCLRSESHPPASNPVGRPLIVRHEETPEKLHEKLSQICRPKSPAPQPPSSSPTGTPPRSKEVLALSRSVFRRESLKTGFRHRLSLEGAPDPNSLAVAVTRAPGPDPEQYLLRVLLFQASCPQLLDEVLLPPGTNLEHLMCVVDDSALLVRERSCPWLSLQGREISCQYMPVIRDDDRTNQLRVVLHVPEVYHFEELSVKTVDENLVISGRRRRRGQQCRPQSFGDLVVVSQEPGAASSSTGSSVFSSTSSSSSSSSSSSVDEVSCEEGCPALLEEVEHAPQSRAELPSPPASAAAAVAMAPGGDAAASLGNSVGLEGASGVSGRQAEAEAEEKGEEDAEWPSGVATDAAAGSPDGDTSEASCAMTPQFVGCHFRMELRLCEKVDSRGVSAMFSKHNQLVIVAGFGDKSRRYTY